MEKWLVVLLGQLKPPTSRFSKNSDGGITYQQMEDSVFEAVDLGMGRKLGLFKWACKRRLFKKDRKDKRRLLHLKQAPASPAPLLMGFPGKSLPGYSLRVFSKM